MFLFSGFNSKRKIKDDFLKNKVFELIESFKTNDYKKLSTMFNIYYYPHKLLENREPSKELGDKEKIIISKQIVRDIEKFAGFSKRNKNSLTLINTIIKGQGTIITIIEYENRIINLRFNLYDNKFEFIRYVETYGLSNGKYGPSYSDLKSRQSLDIKEIFYYNTPNLSESISNQSIISTGKRLFVDATCSSCHLDDGGGHLGPNLTDDYWILGGNAEDIYNVITYGGRSSKGMIGWKRNLPEKDRIALTFYIMSLKNTSPKNPKKPEGELWSNLKPFN